MELPLNPAQPLTMHIDLNSCFATCEQQANPLLRGKPLCIAAYDSPRGCIVSPSIEAKKLGIKTGMRVLEAKLINKNIIVRTPDVSLIRDVHGKFKRIFGDYSPTVVPKSIDEAIIDFTPVQHVLKRNLTAIAHEIKQRMRSEIGEWISCSIGIATNRFLAKTAASLIKPDGLVVITHTDIRRVYTQLKLTDLCGIADRFTARLNAYGIYTPVQFLDAPVLVLKNQVFQSVTGWYWYKRLRGWEVDAFENPRHSFGQDYSIGKATSDPSALHKILMKLCEKMGRRLRRSGQAAQGIHVACVYHDWNYWHHGTLFREALYTTQELYQKALLVFNQRPKQDVIKKLSVACYGLASSDQSQPTLFDLADDRQEQRLRHLSDAVDTVNTKYGEFTITPALMMDMDDVVIDRIAFGGVRELEELYSQ